MDDIGYEVAKRKEAREVVVQFDGNEAEILIRLLGEQPCRVSGAVSAREKLITADLRAKRLEHE